MYEQGLWHQLGQTQNGTDRLKSIKKAIREDNHKKSFILTLIEKNQRKMDAINSKYQIILRNALSEIINVTMRLKRVNSDEVYALKAELKEASQIHNNFKKRYVKKKEWYSKRLSLLWKLIEK